MQGSSRESYPYLSHLVLRAPNSHPVSAQTARAIAIWLLACCAMLFAMVVVVENEHLIGIFTERDAVFRVIAQGLDTTTTRLATVMTAQPVAQAPDKSYGHALVLMQEHRFRHVPIVEDGNVIGIVTARDALDPELAEYVSEQRRREFLYR